MNVLDLFSGIGGFSLGLERAGMRTVAFCEINKFCRQVLAKHWPTVPIYEDVRTITAASLATDGITVDVICGGFPCQDISLAGEGAGIDGERSGLWREYARIISEVRPRFVIVENVAALLGRGLDRVLGDLAAIGFDAEWDCIPASYVGARQLRDRVWIVAYPERNGLQGRSYIAAAWRGKSRKEQLAGLVQPCTWPTLSSARNCGTGHGVPNGTHRNKSIGNAVVPQIPEIIGRAIIEASKETHTMNTIMNQTTGDSYTAINGDCVMAMSGLPDESVGLSVYSPPFKDLFCYSDYLEDMGNCAGNDEFFEQYAECIKQVFRLTKPGRLSAVHCSDFPTKKWRDGYLALDNFSEQISALHQKLGWYLHSRITIWRSPVTEMQRTKALGLLYKQLMKDSSMSRTGMPDYVLIFKKPGLNVEPIAHNTADIPLDVWQHWASPVWMDINQGDVLNVRMAKDNQDEKHVCPLQLPLIERVVRMWSNPGDIVLSPFMGIGSEGYVSVRHGRKFIGTELKPSYFNQACKYLAEAEANPANGNLLAAIGA